MKKLSQIIDLKKIKIVNNTIDKAHGLPNECYTDQDYLSIERKKICRKSHNKTLSLNLLIIKTI